MFLNETGWKIFLVPFLPQTTLGILSTFNVLVNCYTGRWSAYLDWVDSDVVKTVTSNTGLKLWDWDFIKKNKTKTWKFDTEPQDLKNCQFCWNFSEILQKMWSPLPIWKIFKYLAFFLFDVLFFRLFYRSFSIAISLECLKSLIISLRPITVAFETESLQKWVSKPRSSLETPSLI